ncbi:MAG: GTPase ObgE [Fimbriimonadaceae bacterium]
MFLDEAIVTFNSGRGGAGAASFHREKHVPRGGPDGADGGRGGDIILIADRSRRTLYDFQLKSEFTAPNGIDAHGNKDGHNAKPIEIRVPVGTVVYDHESNTPLVDLAVDGMKTVLCKGGRGGFGNLHYTNSVRQAPTLAQKGAPGDTLVARLELKLLADVGLIGLPNAGKSTLISRISAAKPKIANYPFTTIVPNLGVVSVGDNSFTVADMPGLIEGASEGKGLGIQFLKHVERTLLLVHLVEILPLDQSDPVANYQLIQAELAKYSEELTGRPRIVVLNKIDTVDGDAVELEIERLRTVIPEQVPIFPISGVSGAGIEPLLHAMATEVTRASEQPRFPIIIPLQEAKDAGQWDVVRTDSGFSVQGKRIERMIAMTDLASDEALRYLHRRLQKIGVIQRLEELGAQEGDTVEIGNFDFAYEPDN